MQLQNKFLNVPILLFLIFLQVIIFGNINFLGIANPLIYIIFIILLPLNTNRYLVLFYAFVLGLGVDIFELTGGINAFATVLVAFARPLIVRSVNFGNSEESENLKLFRFNTMQWILYLIIIIFLHNFTVIALDQFRISHFVNLIYRTSLGALITFVSIGLYIILFPPKRRSEF